MMCGNCVAWFVQILFHASVETMVQFLDRLGYQCPTYTNPADFLFREVRDS
jgi:hypothetical protein